jgi:hypothetical protein
MLQAPPAFAALENAPAGGRYAGHSIADKKFLSHTLKSALPPL